MYELFLSTFESDTSNSVNCLGSLLTMMLFFQCTFSGSMLGTDQYVKTRLVKARSTFRAMGKLWKSKIIGRQSYSMHLNPSQLCSRH